MWLVSAVESASRVPSVPFWMMEMRFQIGVVDHVEQGVVVRTQGDADVRRVGIVDGFDLGDALGDGFLDAGGQIDLVTRSGRPR